MTLRPATAAIAMAASWTIGCATEARSPEPILIDRVECARCRMLISADAGAGEILSSADDPRFYDDVGCLAADWATHRTGARAFLRLPDGRWQDAQTASYARPQGARTAMGSGFVAFASQAEATAADRDGHGVTFDDLLRLIGGRQ